MNAAEDPPPGRVLRGVEPVVVDDETRFRQVFEEGYQPLVAYARRRTGDPAAADDVVAETFATAWRRRGDLRSDAPALPWLYGIAANVLRNQWRSRGRALRLVERLQHERRPSAAPAAEMELPDPGLHEALSRLSFDDQELLRLLTWEDLSHDDVARVLGCSVNAVGIRAHRARKRLRAELERQVEAPAEGTPSPAGHGPHRAGGRPDAPDDHRSNDHDNNDHDDHNPTRDNDRDEE